MSLSLEKLGRGAVSALGRLLPAGHESHGGVSVLAYHLVDGGTHSPVDIPLERFERQLDYLSEIGTVVSLAEAVKTLQDGTDGDSHKVVLTFDDAFQNFSEVVWPRLTSRSLPATLYVPVGFLDGSSPSPLSGAEHLSPLDWNELRALAESDGLEVGSHSLTHPDLRRLDLDACRNELRESKRRLEDALDRDVRSFCYPRALWSQATRAQVGREFDNAVVAGGRCNRSKDFHPHSISRLPVRRGQPESLAELLGKDIWLEEWVADRWRRR